MWQAVNYYMNKRQTESRDTSLAMTLNRFWFSYDDLFKFLEAVKGE